MSEQNQRPKRAPRLVQRNFDYLKSDVEEAERAAEWEGISISDYYRSALKLRLRETEVKQAEHERRLRGEPIKG